MTRPTEHDTQWATLPILDQPGDTGQQEGVPRPGEEQALREIGKLRWIGTFGRVKNEKSQLGITAICFFGTILHGETEFTALLMF